MTKPNPPETIQSLQQELEAKEAEAANLMQWLKDHPNNSIEEKTEVRRRLNEALQIINELVYQLKRGEIYTIR